MTIRFLKQWNGNSPDDIRTLAGAEETRLVNLGFATTDLDGDNDGERGLVGYRKSLTGRIRNSAGGILLPDANPSANRAVVGGDSRAANSFYDTYPTDKTYRMNGRGWWYWLQGLSGNYWNLVQAAGVTSDKIEDFTARFDNDVPGPLFGGPDGSTAGLTFGVSPYSPDWIFIELGINNLAAGESLASMTAKADALLAKCDETGARVVWLTEGAVNALDYIDRISAWNTWLKKRAATSNNLCVVDVWPLTVDPASGSGYAKSGYLYDSLLHPSPQGARVRADAIWAAVQAKWGVRRATWLPASNAEVYVAGSRTQIANRLGDPLALATPIAVTGTGNTGTLPTNFTAQNCTNATCAYSVVDHPSGIGKCIQMDVDFTAQGGVAAFFTNRIESLFAGGESVRYGNEIFAYGRSGGTQQVLAASHNLLTVRNQFYSYSGANYYSHTGHDRSLTEGPIVGDYNVQPVTWPLTLPAGVPTQVRGQTYVVGAGAGSVRILVGRFALFTNGGPQG